MRIAFVVIGDLSLTSGGFIYDRMLIDRLRARGHEIDVVSLPWGPYFEQLAQNLRAIAWPAPVAEYDVVLQDELAHPTLVVANVQLRRRGVPIVALVHNLTWRQPRVRRRALKRGVESAYLRSVDGALCVCEDTRRDVVRAMGRGAKSRVVYAGRDHVALEVDEAFLRSRAEQPGPLRVLMLCNLVAHKGLHRMLAALTCPAASHVELHVVGAGSDLPYLEEQRRSIRTEGLTERVHFHGELHGPALWEQLRKAHVLALPSDREALPLSAIEALGAGLPVFVTSHGGAAELIRDGIEGRVLDPDAPTLWASALGELASDRSLLSEMSSAALCRYRAQSTWAEAAEVAEGLLREISTDRTRRHPWFR